MFCSITIPLILAFAVLNLIQGHYVEAAKIASAPLALTVLRLLSFRISKKFPLYAAAVCIAFLHFFRLSYHGGTDGSAILWLLTVPIMGFITLGKKGGVIFFICSAIITSTLFIPNVLDSPEKFKYSRLMMLRFSICFTGLGAFGFIYENIRLKYKRQAENHQLKLLEIQENLIKAKNDITEISIRDQLTGCFNRRYLKEKILEEIERTTRYGHPLSVIMCDIDHFKNINDSYGHNMGDLVLSELGRLLIESVRDKIDWVVRFGGEEFMIILPETALSPAADVAERMRKSLEQRNFSDDLRKICVTASFGVASYNPGIDSDDPDPFDSIYKAVDRSLYEAKENGRNRVIMTE